MFIYSDVHVSNEGLYGSGLFICCSMRHLTLIIPPIYMLVLPDLVCVLSGFDILISCVVFIKNVILSTTQFSLQIKSPVTND